MLQKKPEKYQKKILLNLGKGKSFLMTQNPEARGKETDRFDDIK